MTCISRYNMMTPKLLKERCLMETLPGLSITARQPLLFIFVSWLLRGISKCVECSGFLRCLGVMSQAWGRRNPCLERREETDICRSKNWLAQDARSCLVDTVLVEFSFLAQDSSLVRWGRAEHGNYRTILRIQWNNASKMHRTVFGQR